MSHLSRAGIDFDEVRVPGIFFQHKIKSANARESHSPHNSFYGSRDFRVLNRADHGSVPGGVALAEHLKMQTREDPALPANDSAGGFVSRYEGLNTDCEPMPGERRPDQSPVAAEQGPFERSCQKRWRLQLPKRIWRLGGRTDDSD